MEPDESVRRSLVGLDLKDALEEDSAGTSTPTPKSPLATLRRGFLRPFKRGQGRSRSDATAEIRLTELDKDQRQERVGAERPSKLTSNSSCNSPAPLVGNGHTHLQAEQDPDGRLLAPPRHDVNLLPTRRRSSDEQNLSGSRPRSQST